MAQGCLVVTNALLVCWFAGSRFSALHFAAAAGRSTNVKILLDARYLPMSARCDVWCSRSAAWYSATFLHATSETDLVSDGTSADVGLKSRTKVTPLMEAVKNG